jgi:arylformamidase
VRVHDISQPLRLGIPVYPGDTPYAADWTARIGDEQPVNIGTVSMTTHCGTHLDAPLHYDPTGVAIDGLDLDLLAGPCLVLDLRPCAPLVSAAMLPARDLPPRLLLHTRDGAAVERWNPDYPAIAPEAMEHLAAAGVRLVGIDTPSVDPADDAVLPAHMAARRLGLLLLEGLVLDDVPAGAYELIALPLRLVGMDASPVRAILRELPR